MCVCACAEPLPRRLINSLELELMHTAINTWPPIPAFMRSAVSEAWPLSSSLCLTLYVKPVIQLAFMKGAEHHNRQHYQPALREFTGSYICIYLFLYQCLISISLSLLRLSVHHSTCLSLAASVLPLFFCIHLLLMSRFHESVMRRGYSRICRVRV